MTVPVRNINTAGGGERRTTGITFLGMQNSETGQEITLDLKPLMEMDVFLMSQIEDLQKRIERLELAWYVKLWNWVTGK
jgi:hypothetical protein